MPPSLQNQQCWYCYGLLRNIRKIVRNSLVRIVRDGIIIADDKIASLRRFKDDVKEVAEGYECGVTLEHFNDVKRATYSNLILWKNIERTKS